MRPHDGARCPVPSSPPRSTFAAQQCVRPIREAERACRAEPCYSRRRGTAKSAAPWRVLAVLRAVDRWPLPFLLPLAFILSSGPLALTTLVTPWRPASLLDGVLAPTVIIGARVNTHTHEGPRSASQPASQLAIDGPPIAHRLAHHADARTHARSHACHGSPATWCDEHKNKKPLTPL